MNVLAKKMQAKSPMPASYNTLPNYLKSMYLELARYLESQLKQELVMEPIMRGPELSMSENFDICKNGMSGFLFAVGNREATSVERECLMIIEVSAALSRAIISIKLGVPLDPDTPFTLFDVLLVQPISELALEQLRLIGGVTEDEAIAGRSHTMEGLKDINFAKQEAWLKLAFLVSFKANQSLETDKADESNHLTLYITRKVAENIERCGQDRNSNKTVDPDNPWSIHMQAIMRAATRPLEIVIEDIKLSIADCTRLELGQVITLPGASHERLSMKTASRSGPITLTTATLGVFKSNKAVKLNYDLDSSFFE